jgi:pilus assembly protein CpaF
MMEAEGIRLQELYAVIDEAMGTEKMLQGYDRSKKEEIHRMSKREQDIRLLATDGSEEAREFTKNRIYLILSEMPAVIDQNNIDSILSQYHVDYFTNLYTASREENIKKPIDREVEEYFNKFSISRYDSFEKKLMKLAQVLYQELYGYSIVDELVMESELNEVACNRYDYIWIQYKGIKRRVPNPGFRFADEEYYKKIIENRLTSSAREEMNAGEPIIYSTLLNGSRVTALRPPLSRYFVVNIRLFNGRNSTNANRNRFMEDKMQRLIELLAGKGRRNVAIIGEQGSGKTTGADEIIIRSLDDDLSIGLAENIHELNISGRASVHPQLQAFGHYRNVLSFEPGCDYLWRGQECPGGVRNDKSHAPAGTGEFIYLSFLQCTPHDSRFTPIIDADGVLYRLQRGPV